MAAQTSAQATRAVRDAPARAIASSAAPRQARHISNTVGMPDRAQCGFASSGGGGVKQAFRDLRADMKFSEGGQ
jgi:hypothetical protein